MERRGLPKAADGACDVDTSRTTHILPRAARKPRLKHVGTLTCGMRARCPERRATGFPATCLTIRSLAVDASRFASSRPGIGRSHDRRKSGGRFTQVRVAVRCADVQHYLPTRSLSILVKRRIEGAAVSRWSTTIASARWAVHERRRVTLLFRGNGRGAAIRVGNPAIHMPRRPDGNSRRSRRCHAAQPDNLGAARRPRTSATFLRSTMSAARGELPIAMRPCHRGKVFLTWCGSPAESRLLGASFLGTVSRSGAAAPRTFPVRRKIHRARWLAHRGSPFAALRVPGMVRPAPRGAIRPSWRVSPDAALPVRQDVPGATSRARR